MIKHLLLLTVAMTTLVHAEQDDPYQRWLKSGTDWQSRWVNLADQSSAMTSEEKFIYLSAALDVSRKGNLTQGESDVFHRIQNILIQTPGHAEYYRDKIKAELEIVHRVPRKDLYGFLGPYKTRQIEAFRMLELLPSPETVTVLGEFLNDDEGGVITNEDGSLPENFDPMSVQTPNNYRAAQALWELIDNPLGSYRGEIKPDIDIPEWKLWYNQVKAGTRPIRFKGDPKEYHLGNVERASEANRAARRPPVENHASKESSKASKPIPIPWIIGAVAAFLTGASWVILRRRKAL